MAAMASSYGLAPRAGGGGGGFRRAAGPAAALASLPGAWNGSGARHGGLQAPTGTQRQILREAKAMLAAIERELAAGR